MHFRPDHIRGHVIPRPAVSRFSCTFFWLAASYARSSTMTRLWVSSSSWRVHWRRTAVRFRTASGRTCKHRWTPCWISKGSRRTRSVKGRKTPRHGTNMKLSGRKQGHLPVEAYMSPERFEREQEQLFGKVWHFGGFAKTLLTRVTS